MKKVELLVIRVTITQIDLNLEYCLILKWLKKDGDAASKFEIDAHIYYLCSNLTQRYNQK